MSDRKEFTAVARRLLRALDRIEREQVCCDDVTLQQYETLRILQRDTVTTTHVAESLGIDLSTASRNLAVLERHGYVVRERADADARQVTNRLTRKGTRCVESLCCDENAVFASAFERIRRSDRSAVVASMRILLEAVESPAASSSCCPPDSAEGVSDE